ncbi:MAG: histidinol-phosphate transaminase [Microbacteriaceae bacterium]
MTRTNQPPVKLRPEIVAMRAYRQGKGPGPGGFKLSSNENPYPPLPGVLTALAAANSFNRYPDGASTVLRERLAERHGVAVSQIHLGAGSISLLTQLIIAAAGPGDEVVYSWRSFEAYPGIVTAAGASSVAVPNRADAGHDLAAMAAAITPRTRAVLVCTPNNPTGPIVTAQEFADFIALLPRDLLVILDEAYHEFRTDPAAVDGVPVLSQHPNVVVLRTFSKAYGLAGLRIGYAVGAESILDAARATAIAMSVTDQAQIAAIASIELEEEVMERVARIVLQRDGFRQALLDQGWDIPQAQGNFVWLATGDATEAAAAAFFDAGLAVRPFLGEGIRVSVGEPESVEKLLKISQEIVANLPIGHAARRLG